MNITRRIISPNDVEIVIGNYAVTICCEKLNDLVECRWAVPVEWCLEGENEFHHVRLDLIDNDYCRLVTLQYCPSCGKEIKIRKVT